MAFNGEGGGLMAAGSYSGIAALYDPDALHLIALLDGHSGGITQARLSAQAPAVTAGSNLLRCTDTRLTYEFLLLRSLPYHPSHTQIADLSCVNNKWKVQRHGHKSKSCRSCELHGCCAVCC